MSLTNKLWNYAKYLSLIGVAALSIGCGTAEEDSGCETDKQCKGARVCYQGECISPEEVPEEDVYSSDVGEEPTSCNTHTDCQGNKMCIEDMCLAPEEGCAVDYNAICDDQAENGVSFPGIYEIRKSTCPVTFGDKTFKYMGIESDDGCTNVFVFGIENDSLEANSDNCLDEGNDPQGNYMVVDEYITLDIPEYMKPQIKPLEFTVCNKMTMLFKWSKGNCEAILDYYQDISEMGETTDLSYFCRK